MEKEITWLLREKYGGPFDKLRAGKLKAAEKDIERLKNGEHVDYVIGWADFLGLKVSLLEKPLIPRPETEYWTEEIIKEMLTAKRPLKALDIFAGSGCVGLAVLRHIPQAVVEFADIEPRYFRDIRRSARLNRIPARRYKTAQSDVLKNIKGKYDFILANPPYIPSGRKLPASVRGNEPRNALFAGKDGLKYIRAMLRGAKRHLGAAGRLVIEFDSPQKTEIGALARRYGWRFQFSKDQYGRWRTVSLEVR